MKKVLTLALTLAAASGAHAEIYTWRDARGTSYYTNSLHEIPARYRRNAKILDVASGKKSPLSAAPVAPQGQATVSAAAVPPAATASAPPMPSAANGVIAPATAQTPPAAMATIPQPQPARGYVRKRVRHRGASSGEEEEQ